MILKTLTPKQTDIWINNLQKLIALRNAVKKYHNSQYDMYEKQYNERYGFFGKEFHENNFDELMIFWDGYFHSFGIFSKVSRVGPVPPKLTNYMKDLHWQYHRTRDILLKRLLNKWERYAEQPFQIQEGDLEMYENLKVWHQELKEVLEEGGVYDETLDLDEDC